MEDSTAEFTIWMEDSTAEFTIWKTLQQKMRVYPDNMFGRVYSRRWLDVLFTIWMEDSTAEFTIWMEDSTAEDASLS